MAEIHGQLLSVTEVSIGDAFAATAASSARTLTLYDVSDFDELGGYLNVAGTVYAYDTIDMDLNTVHLTTGLSASAAVDDPVAIWDNDTGEAVTERVALVTIDGQGDGDPISADIDHSLSNLLSRTTFAGGQSVTLTQDGESYRLTAVHGKANIAVQKSGAIGGLTYGVDVGGGLYSGLFVGAGGGTVRLDTTIDARVKTPDGSTFMPILASAFTVSSDSGVKTDVADAPDALEIIDAAPAKEWRYKTDDADVKRVGPMADDLPEWLAQVDVEDGTLMVDLARMNGVLWGAVGQQQAQIADLTARITALEGKP